MQLSQRGISLLEVLISLCILTVGLLGVVKMQLHALQAVSSAYNTSIAIIRSESLGVIARKDPENFSQCFIDWQTENQAIGFLTTAELNQNTLHLSWHDRFMQKSQDVKIRL